MVWYLSCMACRGKPFVFVKFHILYYFLKKAEYGTKRMMPYTAAYKSPPGGAGSEVWNRVYMIAPVKKFGRVRLSTNFP